MPFGAFSFLISPSDHKVRKFFEEVAKNPVKSFLLQWQIHVELVFIFSITE